MSFENLPAVNALLNTLSTVLLSAGYVFIKRGDQVRHRNCMVGAFITSTLFLAGYLTYHSYVAYVLGRGPTVFRDPAWFRPIYLAILLTHTVLAMVIVPLVFRSLYLAWRGRFDAHKRVSRWTWPLWMYVSITGVIIYLLLYQIFPQVPPPPRPPAASTTAPAGP